MKLDRLADSGDELYNTAPNVTYWQIPANYVFLFIFKVVYTFLVFWFFYWRCIPVNNGLHTNSGIHTTV